MKTIISCLIAIIMVSCSAPKVLKTDTSTDIDLSGRWNETDAEIATNELFNNLMASSWFKNYSGQNSGNVRIEVNDFESNFKSDKSLDVYFKEYISANQLLDLIDDDSSLSPEFQLNGKMRAEEFITDEQNYIDYLLTAQLQDMKGKVLWQENTTVKKYIKD